MSCSDDRAASSSSPLDGPSAHGFDPSAIVTPANGVTIARLLLSPVLVVTVITGSPSYPVLAFWLVLSLTDGIDGFLARRHGATRSGAFLDPLADKVLVIGALAALTVKGTFSIIPVGVITVREIALSLYRSYWVRRSIAIPASPLAKAKTFTQILAVSLALVPALAAYPLVAEATLWVAVVLAVVSAIQYLAEGSQAMRSGGHR